MIKQSAGEHSRESQIKGLVLQCVALKIDVLASAKTPNVATAWAFAESRLYRYGLNLALNIYMDL